MSQAETEIKIDNEDKVVDELMSLVLQKGIASLPILQTREVEALYALGYNAFLQGRMEVAIQVFEFICRQNVTETRYFKALGAARQMDGKYRAAAEAYGFASILDMEDCEPSIRACECLLHLGEIEKAQSAFEAAQIQLAQRPDEEEFKNRLSELGRVLKNAEKN